jgi:SAM-dependent methyltransferase
MRTEQNLEKALGLLECPKCRWSPLGTAGDDADQSKRFRCPECRQLFSYQTGILDMLGDDKQQLTLAQKSLQGTVLAKGYAWIRDPLALLVVGCTFGQEAEMVEDRLDLQAGDTVLDIACGHGNFTAAIADRIRPGLVIGLDISRSMLEEAAARMHRQNLDNVLLVRGDAHNLPFRPSSISKVNCAGGFHQFPDLLKAITSIYRVLTPGGLFSGSSFTESASGVQRRLQRFIDATTDLHFLEQEALRTKMTSTGFSAYEAERRRWFGYFRATKPVP